MSAIERAELNEFGVLADRASIEAGLRLQARRYVEMGYLAEPPPGGMVIDRWTAEATHFGAWTPDGEVIAIARLIPYGDHGVPCLNDFELLPEAAELIERIPRHRIAEFSALAVEPRADVGLSVSRGLYRAMVQHSLLDSGRVFWTAALATRVRRLLVRVLDLKIERLAAPSFYRGAPTEPVLIDVVGQMRHYSRHEPRAADYFLGDIALDLVDRPHLDGALTHIR